MANPRHSLEIASAAVGHMLHSQLVSQVFLSHHSPLAVPF
jgi:hypothetical protein